MSVGPALWPEIQAVEPQNQIIGLLIKRQYR